MKLISDQVTEQEVTLLLHELERVLKGDITGDVVEMGCYIGTTSIHIAARLQDTGRRFHVYDSFAGLPPKTLQDQSPAGSQFIAGELAATKNIFIQNLRRAHVPLPRITKAWFHDLTPADVPSQIAYAFLDGDYYESICDCLRLVWPRLQPGAIVIVDDYVNEALPGAARAVDEWLRTHPVAQFRVEASLAILYI